MPKDPRQVLGKCASVGVGTGTFTGFAPYMTGGAGAGPAAAGAYPWPPSNIAGVGVPAAALPSYTATGTIVKLPEPTFTGTDGRVISTGDGWFNEEDTTPAPTPIAGCTYPNAWDAQDIGVPATC